MMSEDEIKKLIQELEKETWIKENVK